MDRRVAGHQERCVLAVDHPVVGTFGEIIETDEHRCILLMPDGSEGWVMKHGFTEGRFTAVPVTKIMKADGSWMYYADDPSPENRTKTKWFTRWGFDAACPAP